MGLTAKSMGVNSIDHQFIYQRKSDEEKIIALAGNPNVGKSTIFNNLTGMHQHTGNWPGKTVTTAFGTYDYEGHEYTLVDLPGTYSLFSNSQEEEIARDYVCFGAPDVVIVVCDGVCLERNLNLVLQILEITSDVIVCVNLLDEATKKNIQIDLKRLSHLLGVPVVGTNAQDKKTLMALMEQIKCSTLQRRKNILRIANFTGTNTNPMELVCYPEAIEAGVKALTPKLEGLLPSCLSKRFVALKILDGNERLLTSLSEYIGYQFLEDEEFLLIQSNVRRECKQQGLEIEDMKDCMVSSILNKATAIARSVISFTRHDYDYRDRKIDKLLTSKRTGFPIMIALLVVILWITITGANIPSGMLYEGLFWIEEKLFLLAASIHMPAWLQGVLISGMYRVLAWVVSVMLPPMAIFFPMFTLLEDLGYLPRVAFNLDHQFHKAKACGKQSLTMCMGFGCNAAGVIGCRIIDSPRERLIAILTNNFVPCNGRFPTIISLITMFFIGSLSGILASTVSSLFLTAIIILGIFATLQVSKFLSKTLLKGVPSSFALELPPYRKPQIGKVIIRSIFDRTIFVLLRAVMVAAPAGILIWILANATVGDATLLNHCVTFLDPFAKLIGLDGVIITAFILGFPANEIVLPIVIMTYLATGSITEMNNLNELKTLLVDNGWTWLTGLCMILFSLFHWPCSTTCLTIKKETQSIKWTLIAALIPTLVGFLVCFLVATVARLLFF